MYQKPNNMRIERYIVALIALGTAITVKAQDLDPTVTVTRQYKGKLIEVTKPEVAVTVPDSLRVFDLDIDYSIFDNPYKGAYEFNPYLMDIKPQADGFYGNEFYVRAGAGYALCPTVDIVWTPKTSNKFKISLYASHDSHIGQYNNVSISSDQSGNWLVHQEGDGKWKGYDLHTEAGMNGRIDWYSGLMSFDLGYYGIHTQSNLAASPFQRGYNAADLGLKVASKYDPERSLSYGVSARYRFAHESSADNMKLAYPGPEENGRQHIVSHGLDLDASFGMTVNDYGRVSLDLDASVEALSGLYDYVSVAGLTPKYEYDRGPLRVVAGLDVAFPIRGKIGGNGSGAGQIIYPEVEVNLELVKDNLNVYLEADGGPELNSYADMLASEHFFSPVFNSDKSRFIDAEIKRYGLKFGLEGKISRFFYDLAVGYDDYSAMPFYAMKDNVLLPSLVYGAAQGMTAQMRLGWKAEFLDIEGRFSWNGYKVPVAVFAPSKFAADLNVRYNWRRRVYAGVYCEFASARHSESLSLPYYVDLGVGLEYRATRKLSVWVKGANLMNMTIQRAPVYVEPGINFTAGICLDF